MNISNALKALDGGDWAEAHRIVQGLDTPSAAWLHGVLHQIEGDEANAQYWYVRAGRPWPGRIKVEDEIQAIKRAGAE